MKLEIKHIAILKGTKELPKRVLNPARKALGLRIPDCKVTQALLGLLEEPLLSCSVRLPGSSETMTEPDDIFDSFGKHVDLMLDAGYCGNQLTTVVDFHED